MTSFKNKITNRKRKNSKSRKPENDSVDSAGTDANTSAVKQSEEKKKTGKNRYRNRSKKDVNGTPDKTNVPVSKNCKESVSSAGSNGDVTLVIDKDLETADVVLRNPNSDLGKRNANNSLKRYSDSFVIENNGQADNGQIQLKEHDFVPQVLTRAVSGFFVIDQARKARRFSDLFRHSGAMKLSNSTENVAIKNAKNATKGEKDASIPVKKNAEKEREKKDGRRRSARKKSTDLVDQTNVSNEKPVLAKAKSSSAINLNLLRTRRNKILEQVAARCGSKDVQKEFDFIAFGSVNNVAALGSQTSLNKQPSWLHIHKEEQGVYLLFSGDVKQGQPVSRSGSDRRPDAVREESLKLQDSSSTTDSSHELNDKTEVSTPESTTSLPATGSKRRINSNINRSESVKEQSEKRKQRRNISDPSHNTTGGDVDLDRQPGLSNTDSGSSSNSSISCNGRLSESPSNSVDTVGQTGASRGNLDSDSDMDVDADWQSFVPPEELLNLPPHEKKRQDVINELFHTEGSHVRSLKVLYKIFYKKLQESQILKPEELNLIFPNIKEMLDIHTEINKAMRRRRKTDPIVKEIGDMLVNMFDDRHGESLKKAAATFCERQQLALEFIKKRRERDAKFDALLSECEKKRQCRRLPFQGILPTEMQRLSKYPLLLERLINSVESNAEEQSQQEELANLKKAQNFSKEILNYVNEAAKVAHNKHRLEEIQKHLDTSNFDRSDLPIAQEFKSLDLKKYKLIIEGGMQLRRPNKPVVPVHILLLEEAVIILSREGDNRFTLKFFQSGSNAQPVPLAPIIKMSTLIVRTNAVCKNALFLVNTSTNNSQMYDLMAEDEAKREVWFKHFSDATESHKKREGKRQEAPTDSDDSESVQDLPPSGEIVERAEAVGGDDSNAASAGVDEDEDEKVHEEHKEETDSESATSPEMVAGGGIQSSKVSAEEWPLIQPSQVNIAVPPVLTAESMLTPLEQIRRKDALVKQALEDKEGLVADMMSIPREHFQHIADMASVDTSASREPSERILAAIFQVDQLQKAVNQSLNITEYDAVTAKGGKFPACAGQQPVDEASAAHLSIPVNLVRDLATSLSSQLTTLLSEVKQIEDERDMLRKELHKMRERIHVEHNLHSPVLFDDSLDLTSATDCPSEHNFEDSLQIVTKSDCEEEQ
ncbi:hypothetical protein NQ315_004136 [Exocentrus adspersus]|uniref:DH domain-containing protein n=1 Tax=Exocentrus adspersus TaxID=1586481 RepID=A0AAV8W741_9CUCU|nr:hypothetical protein NQ315_004136 [Exocentrus adspersus]